MKSVEYRITFLTGMLAGLRFVDRIVTANWRWYKRGRIFINMQGSLVRIDMVVVE